MAVKKKNSKLQKLRNGIDQADRQLLHTLARRATIVQKVALAKAELDLPVVQKERQQQIQKERPRYGAKLGLDPHFLEKLFKLIQAESVAFQRKLIRRIRDKKQKIQPKRAIQSTSKR